MKLLRHTRVGRRATAVLAAATVSIAGLVVAPAHARADANIGAGSIVLDLNYGSTVISPHAGPCGPVTPTLSTVQGAAVADAAFNQYAGPVALTVTAPIVSQPCDNLLSESGTISAATFGGSNLGASLTCSTMAGSYNRNGVLFTLNLAASFCNFNGAISLGVALSITGVWSPSMTSGPGDVSDSTVVASFTLQSL